MLKKLFHHRLLTFNLSVHLIFNLLSYLGFKCSIKYLLCTNLHQDKKHRSYNNIKSLNKFILIIIY